MANNVKNRIAPAALKVVLYRAAGTWSCDQCCGQGSDTHGAPCKWCDGNGQYDLKEEVKMEISKEDMAVLARWLKSPEEVKVHLEE